MNCTKCSSSAIIKKGLRNKKQRFYCKDCKKYFQRKYYYKAYEIETDDFIRNLLKEGCGVHSISRVLKISKDTVLSRILKIGSRIKAPFFDKFGCKYEVNEIWSFIGSKSNVTWITYILERETRHVIDFYVGRKSKETIKPLIDKILLLNPKRVYTDGLNIYRSLVPKEIHKRFQYCTNRIERMNLNLRTHIKRLSRKTICFSKNKDYLNAHLRIYFWG